MVYNCVGKKPNYTCFPDTECLLIQYMVETFRGGVKVT